MYVTGSAQPKLNQQNLNKIVLRDKTDSYRFINSRRSSV